MFETGFVTSYEPEKESDMAEAKTEAVAVPVKKVKSWKTTISGIVIGLGIIIQAITPLIDGVAETVFSFGDAWPQILAGLGAMGIGYFARDNDKSSEDVGVKAE